MPVYHRAILTTSIFRLMEKLSQKWSQYIITLFKNLDKKNIEEIEACCHLSNWRNKTIFEEGFQHPNDHIQGDSSYGRWDR